MTEWIRDLAISEQEFEQKGVVDFANGINRDELLKECTVEFVKDLKLAFEATSEHFNQLRGPSGRIKIFGISKTVADFMLLRNGFKMVFSVRQAGVVQVSSSHMPRFFTDETSKDTGGLNHQLVASWGAFDDVIWTHNERPVKLEALVRYYLSFFAKNSL